MALKTVIETTDGLDEAIAALYTETDGKFVLQIEGVDDHPEVAGCAVMACGSRAQHLRTGGS